MLLHLENLDLVLLTHYPRKFIIPCCQNEGDTRCQITGTQETVKHRTDASNLIFICSFITVLLMVMKASIKKPFHIFERTSYLLPVSKLLLPDWETWLVDNNASSRPGRCGGIMCHCVPRNRDVDVSTGVFNEGRHTPFLKRQWHHQGWKTKGMTQKSRRLSEQIDFRSVRES